MSPFYFVSQMALVTAAMNFNSNVAPVKTRLLRDSIRRFHEAENRLTDVFLLGLMIFFFLLLNMNDSTLHSDSTLSKMLREIILNRLKIYLFFSCLFITGQQPTLEKSRTGFRSAV